MSMCTVSIRGDKKDKRKFYVQFHYLTVGVNLSPQRVMGHYPGPEPRLRLRREYI